ncbi:MAG: nucleotide sugar dehydrogenase [Deltaproteobacteria bacterium]|nr:nucleotide sugar dehydrogenase [Deltaproteobacteria bacterium]
MKDHLLERFRGDGPARVAIIGMGYVGVPLGVALAEAGVAVQGVDLDSQRVDSLNRGQPPFPDLDAEHLAALVAAGSFRATCNHGVIAGVDATIIDVPTPLSKTREPDVSLVLRALRQVAEHLHPGQLVVIESTTYPGFTREVAAPLLQAGGLRLGRDVFLAFSPERIDPGNPVYGARNTPRIVGGITPACAEVAAALYRRVTPEIHVVSDTDTAEMVKLHENTFRAVNIALANEVALMSRRLGVDPWEVIDAAATKPFGFMPFYPGPGLGGHCIPVDPVYLSWKMRTLNFAVRFIELAEAINTSMPEVVVHRLHEALDVRSRTLHGSRILVLGVTYKRDVGDVRESPALEVIRLLRDRGVVVCYHDPWVPALDAEGIPLRSVPWEEEVTSCDAALILADHVAVDYARLVAAAPLVFDTRGVTRRLPPSSNVVRL